MLNLIERNINTGPLSLTRGGSPETHIPNEGSEEALSRLRVSERKHAPGTLALPGACCFVRSAREHFATNAGGSLVVRAQGNGIRAQAMHLVTLNNCA